jgi:hypothetical protein
MTDTVTSRFLKKFDPSQQTHVAWLKNITDIAESIADPTKPQHIVAELNANPMKVVMSKSEALDWPHVHFVLCAAYAKAIFKCKAWVPGLPSTSPSQ